MTDDRVVQHAQRHFISIARVATRAANQKDIRAMEQRTEGVKEYARDITRRCAQALQQPVPPLPPLPLEFDPGPENETAREFAIRCLNVVAVDTITASQLEELAMIQSEALLFWAFAEAAQGRLMIAILEAREKRKRPQ